MEEREEPDWNGEEKLAANRQAFRPRPGVSPLSAAPRVAPFRADEPELALPPHPDRAVAEPLDMPEEIPSQVIVPPEPRLSGLRRAANAVRAVAPIVGRILPLLDGNFATAISGALSPASRPAAADPLEQSVAELKREQSKLRDQAAEQQSALKRIEDRLGAIVEAANHSSREQRELASALKSVRTRINVWCTFGLALLIASILINLFFFLHLGRFLP